MKIEKLSDKIVDECHRKQDTEINTKNITSMIDHTLLKPEASISQIEKLCDEAREYKFASCCVNPSYVSYVSQMLSGSSVKTCCVIGFPLGATTSKSKVEETKEAVINGADEIDMVINVGAIKSGDWDFVKSDITEVIKAAGSSIVKVIIETCLLTNEEKVLACKVSKEAGAAFVKTSTGFSTGGATVEDVSLMRKTVGPDIGVKAAGGIRNYKVAMEMIRAGASRIGTSGGIEIAKSEGTS